MTKTTPMMTAVAAAAGIALLSAGDASATVVFNTDFEVAYSAGNGAFALGGATPDVAAGDFFGSSNQVGVSGDPGLGDLSFSNNTANRFRGSGVWLDTTGWEAGLVTVEVDVTNFVAGADTDIVFQAYGATGVDATSSVSLDLHGAITAGALPTATGTATIGTLGDLQTIGGNGIDTAFTFDFNGTDDFVALTFVQLNAAGGTAFGSADLDNLTVSTIPEPASMALLALGGLCTLGRRRNK